MEFCGYPGVITLRLDDTVKIKGDWKLQSAPPGQIKEAGPQDGAGKIVGQLKGQHLSEPESVRFGQHLFGRKVTTPTFRDQR